MEDGLDILKSDSSIGQVLFNVNYAETEADHDLAGGYVRSVNEGEDSFYFIEHEYYAYGTEALALFVRRNSGQTCAYWPHFALRPSLIRTSILSEVFKDINIFKESEFDLGRHYVQHGFKSVFFPSIYCLRWEDRGNENRNDPSSLNAYSLDLSLCSVNPESVWRVKPVSCFLTTSDLITYLHHQCRRTSEGEFRWNRIMLTDSDDADYFAIIHHPGEEYHDPKRSIYLQTEPIFPDGINLNQYLFRRFLSMGHYCADWHISRTYPELHLDLTKPGRHPKTKLFSTIMSSLYYYPGHKKRIDFIKYYTTRSDVPPIDIYGRDNQHGFPGYQGSLTNHCKEEGLLPYKYTFHAENHQIDNYFTEKLTDSILCETLCFYWGCPNVSDTIDHRAYIQLDFTDFEQSANIIRDAIEGNEWEKRIDIIRHEKRKILEKIHFFPGIERCIQRINKIEPEYAVVTCPNSNQYVFRELEDMICYDLRKKGFKCEVRKDLNPTYKNIIMGLNVNPWIDFPAGSIVVNMEQLYDESGWLRPEYVEHLKNQEVWDYCESNQKYLREKMGISTDLIHYGYLPSLDQTTNPRYVSQVDNWENKETDVLVIGSKVGRRCDIVSRLKEQGLNVIYLINSWEEERMDVIYKAKIILNVHFYPAGLVEMPRISLLLNNRAFIISETCTNMEDFPYLENCMVLSEYDRLIDTIEDYLKRPTDCLEIAKRGYETFKKIKPSVPIYF